MGGVALTPAGSPIRFDHIAIALHRMADAPAVLVGVLGGVPDFGAPAGLYRFGQWRFAGGGRIEILEPMGEDGFLHRFLAQRGPGVHHVTFKVPSLREACDRAAAHGYEVVGFDDSDPRWKEAFLHPKQALGIVVQLAESSLAGGGGPRRWQPAPGPPEPPPPVTILGLRMRARSHDRARTQWELVLQGEGAEAGRNELIYRWPGSPMRIAVAIDPAAAEGPVAIELASERALALPGGPHPILGTVFAQSHHPTR
jgi:catechol 2,3-dioxygenase-like lactoylglutathione lyase family enzyme